VRAAGRSEGSSSVPLRGLPDSSFPSRLHPFKTLAFTERGQRRLSSDDGAPTSSPTQRSASGLWVACNSFSGKSAKFGISSCISQTEVLRRAYAICSPANVTVSSAYTWRWHSKLRSLLKPSVLNLLDVSAGCATPCPPHLEAPRGGSSKTAHCLHPPRPSTR
jgi:hypothetical protein